MPPSSGGSLAQDSPPAQNTRLFLARSEDGRRAGWSTHPPSFPFPHFPLLLDSPANSNPYIPRLSSALSARESRN